ncbi:MAG: aspartate--tRNA ligase [Patescibacteria group bacterium]
MERSSIKDLKNKIGKSVKISGWVDARRDHGKLIFLDLRDAGEKVQTVILPEKKEVHHLGEKIRPEWILEMIGEVKKRPEKMVNPELLLGDIEIEIDKIIILNQSKTPPFDLSTSGYEVDEEIRLLYRYLDLRRQRLQKNLKIRHEIIKFIRDELSERGFIEIETPLLTKSTPEGARDYVVPSRLHPGKFYALPQSPQQYKQLLMVAGIEKYFQIAKCLRDEDTRGDRQPEFTQLDLEMSFIDENEVMNLIEEMMIKIIEKFFPNNRILKRPFPREKYGDVIKNHQTDAPDIRNNKSNNAELAFLWVTDFPLFEYSDKEKRLVSVHHPFTSPHLDEIEMLDKFPKQIRARAYDLVLNGFEIGGGSIRIYQRDLQEKIFKILGIKPKVYNTQFGHLLEAFEFGVPPHGGIALGLDRLIAILQDEPNIREVIAFPKTGDGRDLMMNAPTEIDKEQLKELDIEIKKKKY